MGRCLNPTTLLRVVVVACTVSTSTTAGSQGKQTLDSAQRFLAQASPLIATVQEGTLRSSSKGFDRDLTGPFFMSNIDACTTRIRNEAGDHLIIAWGEVGAVEFRADSGNRGIWISRGGERVSAEITYVDGETGARAQAAMKFLHKGCDKKSATGF